MNSKVKTAIIISLVITLVFGVVAFFLIRKMKKPEEMVSVAVATKEIKAGEIFTDENYIYKGIPKKELTSSHITKIAMEDGTYTDTLKGKEVKSDIYPNEKIMKGRVSGMSVLTDENGETIDVSGYRKLMYEVGDSNSLSGQVQAGDRLDFWVRYKLNDKTNKDQLVIVDKILKNVIVNKCYDSNGEEVTNTSIPVKTVEILLTEKELQEYIKYKDLGKYTLVKVPAGQSSDTSDDIVRKKLSTNDLIWEIISMDEDQVTSDKITKDPSKEQEIVNFEISSGSE